MALHASKIAAGQIQEFLKGTISRALMEQSYSAQWNKLFSKRLRAGRMLQRLLNDPRLTNLVIGVGRYFPSLIKTLVKKTHGDPF